MAFSTAASWSKLCRYFSPRSARADVGATCGEAAARERGGVATLGATGVQLVPSAVMMLSAAICCYPFIAASITYSLSIAKRRSAAV